MANTNMNYRINPVKATCWKLSKDNSNGIQRINDTCYGVCASFSGTNDVYNMDRDCSRMCDQYVEKRKKEIFGVGSCDHQTPHKPVIWENVPRLFPQVLKMGLKPDDALQACKQVCKKRLNPSIVQECMNYCDLDYHAIEGFEDKSGIIVSPTGDHDKTNKVMTSSCYDKCKGSPNFNMCMSTCGANAGLMKAVESENGGKPISFRSTVYVAVGLAIFLTIGLIVFVLKMQKK